MPFLFLLVTNTVNLNHSSQTLCTYNTNRHCRVRFYGCGTTFVETAVYSRTSIKRPSPIKRPFIKAPKLFLVKCYKQTLIDRSPLSRDHGHPTLITIINCVIQKNIENLRVEDRFQCVVCFCFGRYFLTCCSCLFRCLILLFNVSWSLHQCTSHWKVFLIILAACTSFMVCVNNLFWNKVNADLCYPGLGCSKAG